MLAKISSCALVGLNGVLVDVEVDVHPGQVGVIDIVGLPDAAIQESRQRVHSAISNSNLRFPQKRVTINLAPADLRKEGPAYDLPIAVGILAGANQLPIDYPGSLFIGELSLDGGVRHVNGIISMASVARDQGIETLYVPAVDAAEASLVPGLTIIPVENLGQLAMHLNNLLPIAPHANDPLALTGEPDVGLDFAEIRGQEHVKRALEVAAAGGHCCLMKGPPGAGKTLIARALPGILPQMSIEEALEVTKIYSVCGMLSEARPLMRRRPFRAPHHTISQAGLGGWRPLAAPRRDIARPTAGVLFPRRVARVRPAHAGGAAPTAGGQDRDHLRGPPARSAFPANFMLIGAMNPCPCGYYGDPSHECTCSRGTIDNYQKRISGPLMDRIDNPRRGAAGGIRKAGRQDAGRIVGRRARAGRGGAEAAASTIRWQRFSTPTPIWAPPKCANTAIWTPLGGALIKAAMAQMGLSARAYHRVLKLARTVARPRRPGGDRDKRTWPRRCSIGEERGREEGIARTRLNIGGTQVDRDLVIALLGNQFVRRSTIVCSCHDLDVSKSS